MTKINTEHYKMVVEDFAKAGFDQGELTITDLARAMVDTLDFDNDQVIDLIKTIKEEQNEYLEDFYALDDEFEEEELESELEELKQA